MSTKRQILEPAEPARAHAADGYSLRDLIDISRSGTGIIVSLAVAGAVIGASYGVLATPTYRADALVQLERHHAAVPVLERLRREPAPAEPVPADTEIEVLRSRRVLGRVVDELDLQVVAEPERSPLIDALAGRRHPGVERRSRLRAIEELRDRLEVSERGEGTGILELRLEGRDPGELEVALNAIAEAYVREHGERRAAEARQSLEFLESKLPELEEELEQAEDALDAFRRDHHAVDLNADAQHLLAQIVAVERNLVELELERVEADRRFAAEHPRMRAIGEKERQLRKAKAALERQVEALPGREKQALRLRREVDVATQLYTDLLTTAQELRVVQAGARGAVRLLDPAARPERPVAPRPLLVGGLSTAFGLILGIGLVFGRHALQRAVPDPDALEAALGVPVSGSIPHSLAEWRAGRRAERRPRVRRPLLADGRPEDPAVEALRSLRTGLHRTLLSSQPVTLAITSAHERAGATFVSMNLGYLFAELGHRVLVIDADMRRGRLHEYLGLARDPGLAEVLAGTVAESEAVRRFADPPPEGVVPTRRPGELFVLTSGELPANPAELLMGGAMGGLITWGGARYDVVIVDTPPLLSFTDAAVAGAHAQAIFLVARAGHSRIESLAAAQKRLRHSDLEMTGVWLNDREARDRA